MAANICGMLRPNEGLRMTEVKDPLMLNEGKGEAAADWYPDFRTVIHVRTKNDVHS
jgi:hypothetical protein